MPLRTVLGTSPTILLVGDFIMFVLFQLCGVALKVLQKYFHAQIDPSKPLAEQYRVSFYIGGIFNHFLMWFSRGMQESPEQMTAFALSTLPPQFIPYLTK